MYSSANGVVAFTAAAACALLTVASLSSAGAPGSPHERVGSATGLRADYRFDGNLKSSVKGAPRLHNLGDGNSFVISRVPGEGRTQVLKIPHGNGLEVDTGGLIPSKRYSVVMNFRLAGARTEAHGRIRNPALPGGVDGTKGRVTAGKFVEVALTRSPGGRLRVYVDGRRDLSYLDTEGLGVVRHHRLRFFFDSSHADTSAGRVSRIRLWSDALSAKKVKKLYNQGH